MKFLKSTLLGSIGVLIMFCSVFAQGQQMQKPQSANPDSISKKELKQFVGITQKMQKMQQKSQKQIDSLLSGKKMDRKRFSQIMMSKRMKQAPDSLKATPEEQKTIKEIQPKLQKMQMQSRQKIMAAINDSDLTPQRFSAIMQSVRANRQVMMKRIQQIKKDSAM